MVKRHVLQVFRYLLHVFRYVLHVFRHVLHIFRYVTSFQICYTFSDMLHVFRYVLHIFKDVYNREIVQNFRIFISYQIIVAADDKISIIARKYKILTFSTILYQHSLLAQVLWRVAPIIQKKCFSHLGLRYLY